MTSRDHILHELRTLETRAERLRRRLSTLGEDDSSISEVEYVDSPSRLVVYDLVIEHLSEAVLMISDRGKILEANKTAREMFELSRRRYGMTGIETILGDEISWDESNWFNRLRSEIAWGFEAELKSKGQTFSAEVLVVYVEHATRRMACVLIRDVTPQKRANRDEALSRERLDKMFKAIADLIFMVRADGTFVHIASQNDLLLSQKPEQLIGGNIRDAVPPQLAATVQQKITQAIESGQIQELTYRLMTQTGDVAYFEAWVAPQDQDNVLILVRHLEVGRDLERARDELVQRLEDKNQELQQFTYRISHDLKNPLVSIKGFAQLMAEDLAEGQTEDLEDHVSEISLAADKMQWLIDQILDLSRVGAATVELETLNMREVIDFAVRQVGGHIQSIGAEVVVQSELPSCVGDFHQLSTVFQNLIDNACKYAGDARPVRIEIGTQEIEGRMVWLVKDNGSGIDPSQHQKVFELFQRLDRRVKGSGVGLALVKRIIEVHGGRIWIEQSQVGEGTTVAFSLDYEDDWSSLENS